MMGPRLLYSRLVHVIFRNYNVDDFKAHIPFKVSDCVWMDSVRLRRQTLLPTIGLMELGIEGGGQTKDIGWYLNSAGVLLVYLATRMQGLNLAEQEAQQKQIKRPTGPIYC